MTPKETITDNIMSEIKQDVYLPSADLYRMARSGLLKMNRDELSALLVLLQQQRVVAANA